jgi:hypothetical protein
MIEIFVNSAEWSMIHERIEQNQANERIVTLPVDILILCSLSFIGISALLSR